MSRRLTLSIIPVLLLSACALVGAEDIKLATYNIENFREHFEAHRWRGNATTRQIAEQLPPDARERFEELLANERRQNDEDNWELAQVILDKELNPDILVIQEGCDQKDLEYFNKRWLNGAYETVIVFATNSTRGQTLGVLLKPGFKVLEKRDQYHQEPDPVPNPRGERLFARGPAFALVQSPSGYKFWVGTTHQKSKGGNNVDVTAWRNREAKRTHEIIVELSRQGPEDVILLGDFNDEPGIQEFEMAGGGDTVANVLGPPEAGLVLATKPLIEAGQISFGGYWDTRYRSFIDHIITTGSVRDQIRDVKVFQGSLTRVASDHYPVMIQITADPVSAGNGK